MIPDPTTERTHRQRLGLFFLIWAGCLLLFSLLSAGFLMLVLGKEQYDAMTNAATFSDQFIQINRYLQVVFSVVVFGLPPLLFILLAKPRDWRFPKMDRFPDLRLLGLTVLLIGFGLPIIEWLLTVNKGVELPAALHQLEDWLHEMEARNAQFLKAIMEKDSYRDFLINFITIAIIPPIVEELMFRGGLQQLFQKQIGPHAAIIVTGAIFSLIHMEFYGFLPRMMLGILFGYLFYWSGSLWVPIFAHFLYNGLQVVLLFLFQREVFKGDMEQTESFPPYMIMGATVLFFITLYIFDRIANKEKPQDGERLGESILDE